MFEILRFWLRKGADGFRLDVADYYIKDEQLRSNPLMMTKPQYFFQNRMYNQDREEVTDILREIRQVANEFAGDRCILCEVATDRPDKCALVQGKADAAHLSYCFDTLYLNKLSVESFRNAFMERYAALEQRDKENWAAFQLSNHDVNRAASRFHQKNPNLQ